MTVPGPLSLYYLQVEILGIRGLAQGPGVTGHLLKAQVAGT